MPCKNNFNLGLDGDLIIKVLNKVICLLFNKKILRQIKKRMAPLQHIETLKRMENPGIDPGTSHMLSERSTT